MNVIFLDIDGVLTSYRQHMGTREKDGFGGAWKSFDPVAVNFLNYLARTYDAQLVLSSTWRHCFGDIHKALPWILVGGGLRIKPHEDWVTPLIPSVARGVEIAEWIKQWQPDNYIIFDDNSDAGYGHGKFFVQTCGMNGMMFEHMERAERICKEWKTKEGKNGSTQVSS